MRPQYKQKCIVCRKNMVLISAYRQVPVCAECKMKEINRPIVEEPYRTMFAIDEELYKQSSFLRNIKANYLRFGKLSEKQIETFKKVAEELKQKKGIGREPSESGSAQ
jgi:hypothetical protein